MINLPTLSAQTNAWLRHLYSFLGGAGLVFGLLGIDDATRERIVTAVHQIGDGVASILAGLGVLVPIGAALWARWTAKPEQQVKAVEAQGKQVVDLAPASAPPPPSPAATVRAVVLAPVALWLALMLSGCGDHARPTNDVLAAMTSYQAALTVAVAYNELPRCAAGGPALCSDQNVVEAMRKANHAALIALKAAEDVVVDPAATSSAISAAIATANQAVGAFQAIAAIYKVK